MAPKQRGVHISLWNVMLVVPENEGEREMLKSDLYGIGCVGLLERPWNIKNEEFVQQFVMIREQKIERSNIFDTTIRDQPEEWTAGVWKEVYDFAPGRGGMANWTDQYIEGKFRNKVDPKDGFPVRDCRDAREHRVLEFLVPIVHTDKPTRVTRKLGNTIFGALNGERSVDWAIIFMELVNRLVGGAGKAKPTPICPFLYHLYESKGLLTKDEETDYKAAQELNRYQITLNRDPESESEVRLIVGPEPNCVIVPVNQVRRENRLNQTYQALEGSPPTRSRGEGSQPNSEGARPMSPRPMSPPPMSPPPERPQPE